MDTFSGLLPVALVGIAAQLVDGSLGMGYGVTSATLLAGLGYSPAAASATIHLAKIGTGLASGLSHWRSGNVHWRAVLLLAVPGAIGAFAGAFAISHVAAEVARPWVSVVLAILGWVVSRIDHAVLGGLVGGMILFYNAEGVLGLVGLDGSAVVVTRVLIVVGALALTLSTWMTRVRDLEAEAVPVEIDS